MTPRPKYAELQVTTNYSFLRGASHPAELMITAAALGLQPMPRGLPPTGVSTAEGQGQGQPQVTQGHWPARSARWGTARMWG